MKWLVLSDSHGMRGSVYDILDSHPDAAGLFFLGDGLDDVEYVENTHPHL